MRILFTGGSGKAGKHSINYLVEHGHSLLNIDQVNLEHPKVLTLFADITDAGKVFDVMCSYSNYDELDKAIAIPNFDAVLHFAAF